MYPVSLIFRLLVLHLMIEQTNQMADRLGLEDLRISHPSQITEAGGSGPIMHPGFYGSVHTTNFVFTLLTNMLIVTHTHRQPSVEDWRDDDGRLGVPRGSVNDKMAYDQARGWLEALGIDVAEMEKKHRPRVRHRRLPITRGKTVSSGFSVEWGVRPYNADLPLQRVQLNASKKWLVSLYLTDLSFYRHPLPRIDHAVPISLLPDAPVREFLKLDPQDSILAILKKHGTDFTNVFRLLQMPAGYEEQGLHLLSAQAKKVFSILECQDVDELQDQNVEDAYVYPPAFGFGGHLRFRTGEIRFDQEGKLSYFYFRPAHLASYSNYIAWAKTTRAVISTNETYQIAAQKLAALSIDVGRLNRELTCTLEQTQVRTSERKEKTVFYDSPVFLLEWLQSPADSRAVARIMVDGKRKKLVHLELNDPSYCRRQFLVPR